MPTRIGLISDVHASLSPLRDALAVFARERVDMFLCAGDIAGYGTELAPCVALLDERRCVTLLGNHEIWSLDRQAGKLDKGIETFFRSLPLTWKATLEGKRIMAVHASPPDSVVKGITLLDQDERILNGDKERWCRNLEQYRLDVLIVGHTHQVFAEMLGQTLVINPGSTVFNHTCAVLSLPERTVKFHPLLKRSPRRVWHWGMMSGRELL